jgi:hypothetical protein
MMGRANNSSVDTTKGDRLAKKMNEKRNVLKAGFAPDGSEKKEQVINARKAANVQAEKEKRKKNAKLAKAAKKKNKKK